MAHYFDVGIRVIFTVVGCFKPDFNFIAGNGNSAWYIACGRLYTAR